LSAPEEDPITPEDMRERYKAAVEKAIRAVPVKNGVVDIDSIWVETSVPYDLLQEILSSADLTLPENVERVNTKSRRKTGETGAGPKRGKPRRRGSIRN